MFQVLGCMRLLRRLKQQGKLDVINAHWIYPDGVAAVWMARQLGVPVMLTALGSDINVYSRYPLRRSQILWALHQANGVTAVSRALVTAIEGFGVDPSKLQLIRNGINADSFSRVNAETVQQLRRQFGLRNDRKYLVFVGRLHPVKGLIHLLDALNLLFSDSNLNFDTILVGDGELRLELERSVAARGLNEHVRFAGEVPHSRVNEWLQAGDAFCLPSLMEGMPNVVIEAQACGLPVVASSVGGLPDMVGTETGILVAPAKPADLASALNEVFRKEWDREKIAREADGLSWEAVASQYLAAIEGMSSRNSRA
jgi:glycosyltransferase involved in cell wall biosynthesis